MAHHRKKLHRLNREISKQARLDRRYHLIDKFHENPNDPNKSSQRFETEVHPAICPHGKTCMGRASQ